MKLLVLLVLCLPILAWAKPRSGGRIVGGQDAAPGQFPFAVAIYKITPEGAFLCAGTLLREEWVFTSAQCVVGATSFILQFGSVTLSGGANQVVVSSTEYYRHMNFNSTTLREDLGFIKLQEPLVWNAYIRGIDFSNNTIDYYSAGAPVVSLGWGDIDDAGQLNDVLQYANLEMTNLDECRVFYGTQVTGYMTCAHGSLNQGICFGDIGGPLITKNVDRDEWVLIGTALFLSPKGCESLDPSVYTRVDMYTFWINLIMTHM